MAGTCATALAAGRRVVARDRRASARRSAWSSSSAAADVPARVVPPGSPAGRSATGVVTVTTGRLDRGLDAPGAGLLVVTETDIRGQKGSTRDMARMPSRRRNTVDPLQLATGRLRGPRAARRRPLRRDDPAHRRRRHPRVPGPRVRARASAASRRTGCYVPTDQLDQVTRYVGGEAPSVHRLGGADWQQTKSAPGGRSARSPAS